MNQRYRFLSGVVLLLLSSWPSIRATAQQWQDTLHEVQVSGLRRKDTLDDARRRFASSQTLQKIDPVYLDLYAAQSLSNLLAQQSPVFIKSYGVNSMATLSLRGASAAQSAVLWNGVPILNPALGVADLSLLRTGLFRDVSLQYGSSAALFGSGNVGGALLLDNAPAGFYPRKDLELRAGAGSFGRLEGSLNAAWQGKRLKAGINTFWQQADNDIAYTDAQGREQRLSNARLKGAGTLLTLDYNPRKEWSTVHNDRLYLRVWWQRYHRQIPPALFEQLSVKEQEDISLRTLLGWEKNTRRSTFYAKASYNREFLHYQDSMVLLDNEHRVQQYYQELGWRVRLDNPDREPKRGKARSEHSLLLFAPLQYAVADGENISGSESQFRPVLAAAYHFAGYSRKLEFNAALRQEWVNGAAAPVLPGAGMRYRIWQLQFAGARGGIDLRLTANIQRTYRIPTLNELYYFPGGNPDLKPEQGWSQDGGYAAAFSYGAFSLKHELEGFNRHIKDWIYWLGGAIWTPHNIAGVHSRGMETRNKLEYKAGQVKVHLGLNYVYVLSTTTDSYLPGDGSIGKQIPYTPRYNIQCNVGFQWKGALFFNYNHTYTGYRFVTVDESQYLEPYTTGNLQAGYTLYPSGGYRCTLAAQLQNVFNTAYEVVGARPMPGRNFLLQLSLGLRR